MTKQQLLELEKNAHLTIEELRKTHPALAKPIQERIGQAVQRLVAAQFAGGSEKLRAVAAKITIPLGANPEKVNLRTATLTALRKAVAKDRRLAGDKNLKKELDKIGKASPVRPTSDARSTVTLADALSLNEPVLSHPEFRADLDAARVYRLSDATGLGDATAKIVIDYVGAVANVTDERLEALIKDRTLSRGEAKAVGVASSFFHLLDERPELVALAKTGVADIRDLVKKDKAVWLKIIKDSKTKPPGGIAPEDYAELLGKKVARLFPTKALAHRLSEVKVAPVLSDHLGLAELRNRNPGVLVVRLRDFDSLSTDGLDEASRTQLRSRYENVARMADRYKGMKLEAVLDDAALSDAEREREVTRRVDLANRFFADNAEVLGVDLTVGSNALGTLQFVPGASDADKAMVLATVRTYQRAMAITENVADAEALVAGGFPSALSVANAQPATLIARTGLKPQIAGAYYEKAKNIALGVTARAGTVIDIFKGGFNETAVGNLSPGLEGYLKEIPGFADFFGNQDFCNCKHCNSILSPAAYFVDLMHFVDEHVTKKFFANQPDHPLNLKSRRPDLWTLELTCENTNKPIPYLVIINEILENALATLVGFAGNFGDRVAVGKMVYQDTLPDHVNSFTEPFNLPFEELRTYLKHFDRILADAGEAGNAAGEVLARLRLALPPRDYELITQPNDGLLFLRRIYRTQFTDLGGTIQKFDAQMLLRPMGVSRDELSELIVSRFVTNDGAFNIGIKGEKRRPDSIQNDIENIEGLTSVALDRMHRFVRLWRATGWRIGELDLALSHLKQEEGHPDISPDSVRDVARVHRLHTTLDISVEELVALWSVIPNEAIVRSMPSVPSPWDGDQPSVYPQPESALARLVVPLFDRLFNQPRFVETGGPYPQAGTMFLHPALASGTPANIDANLHRLQAGTGTDEDQFYQLIVGLARPLGLDLNSTDDNRKMFALNHRNLSLLYRHARLAKLLKVSIPQLFALTALSADTTLTHIESVSDLEGLLTLHAWWKTTQWTIAEFIEIVRPEGMSGAPLASPQETASPDELAQGLVEQVKQSGALVFADTVFALAHPTKAFATSRAQVTSTAGGETVTYDSVLNGRAETQETITLKANATLGDVIADWNSKAISTNAFRSDEAGNDNASGTYLSIAIKDAAGSTTRLTITADSSMTFTASVPIEYRGAEITPVQSRAIFALPANSAVVEIVDTEGRYRLKSGFDPNATLQLPPDVDTKLGPALQNILRAYHSRGILLALLPSRVGGVPEHIPNLVAMLGLDLDSDAYFRELRGDLVPPTRIAGLISKLRRLAIVFGDTSDFGGTNFDFIRTQATLFGIADFDQVSTTTLRRIELFRVLSEAGGSGGDETPDLKALLLAFDPVTRFAGANQDQLAEVLGCHQGLLQSLHAQLSLSTTPFEVLEELMAAVEVALHVGIGGNALRLIQSSSYDDLVTASAALQSAFRAKYADEAEWEKQVEPFRDAMLSGRRNGLVAYLLHFGSPRFNEVSDLFHHFLLDIQLAGCARTSRVASAIDTVQLYVHRCLMNLEETAPGDTNRVHVLPESVPDDEWAWRRNYRVWEANRKVFLYPENHIEPEWRDNKTPLFKVLEEELFSKEVTEEAILNAYARYLRGFDELSHLFIAGSYHEKDDTAERDTLHLFGVTSEDPPVFYYRRVENAHYGVCQAGRATNWGAWEKLNIQVPVRKIAPIVHNGQLYVFWVRYVTTAQNELEDKKMKFLGYKHRTIIEFSRRTLDGNWTSPQKLRLGEKPFDSTSYPKWFLEEGVVLDPLIAKAIEERTIDTGNGYYTYPVLADFQPLYDNKTHPVPMDDYTLKGFQWDQLYPRTTGSELILRGVDFQLWSPVDLYRLTIGPQVPYPTWGTGVPVRDQTNSFGSRYVWSEQPWMSTRRDVYSVLPPPVSPLFDLYSYASLLVESERIDAYDRPLAAINPDGSKQPLWPQWNKEWIIGHLKDISGKTKLGDVPKNSALEVVNGSCEDFMIQIGKDVFYLQGEVREDGKYHLRRLNTSVSTDIIETLFSSGLEGLLATSTQLGLKEHSADLIFAPDRVHNETHTGSLDFHGPMGTYLREIFFHIPFLIANYLNSQGRHEEAQRWFHHIFDPTATEMITDLPAGISPEDTRRRLLDRCWRYREFRGQTFESLRAQLTDEEAIDQYKRDPFNPHAIARLRLSAYQKSIVAKYIDNLLDWGDELFGQAFSRRNPEYLREATLKYVTAQEILGKRPARLGDCGEGKLTPKIYQRINDTLRNDSEFLMEMESISGNPLIEGSFPTLEGSLVAVNAERAARATKEIYAAVKPLEVGPVSNVTPVQPIVDGIPRRPMGVPLALRASSTRSTIADAFLLGKTIKEKGVSVATLSTNILNPKARWASGWGRSFVREVSPIFCVPGNERLLGYWDRVEDRLYKLRHCRDIEGAFRQLPLFAAPIDPGLLVGAKSAGLSFEDIFPGTSGHVPPYRFGYLIEKAKSFASTVQSFGATLLAALEKRDAEEMARLRNVQQKNMLALTREIKKDELKISEENTEIVKRRQDAVQYRKEYYEGLLAAGLSPAEQAETATRILSSLMNQNSSMSNMIAAHLYLMPQAGSPFSLNYGGKQWGDNAKAWGEVGGNQSQHLNTIALISGIVANFQRREQDWRHQATLAGKDLKSVQRELVVAGIQKAIATHSLELHQKEVEHHDEVMELFEEKFSNLGLYTYLSRRLQQLHREAYHHALSLARLAEQAYRFERPDDTTVFVGGEWEASRAGLLAGEQLFIGLQRMEKRFIETNARQAEITQSFSLGQVDPEALITLKEASGCNFAIPEFYFDLFYPGQYRRRIRAVRVTIPCVTGPFTNVSAKLTLLKSFIRTEAAVGPSHLLEVPPDRTASVATSTAQNDAGVFELNFRDERYMPFEGAGAISDWRMELPSNFRPFDYRTISDVILSISYTAEDSESLRGAVENQLSSLEGSLAQFSMTRVLSLRQDFPNAFHRLTQSAAGTSVTLDITDQHFPLFLQGRSLTVASGVMVLVVADRSPVDAVSISLNGTEATGFSNPTNPPSSGDPLGGLPAKAIDGAFAAGLKRQHTIVVNDAGNLAAGAVAGPLFELDKLRDILLVIEYRL